MGNARFHLSIQGRKGRFNSGPHGTNGRIAAHFSHNLSIAHARKILSPIQLVCGMGVIMNVWYDKKLSSLQSVRRFNLMGWTIARTLVCAYPPNCNERNQARCMYEVVVMECLPLSLVYETSLVSRKGVKMVHCARNGMKLVHYSPSSSQSIYASLSGSLPFDTVVASSVLAFFSTCSAA